MKTDDRGRTIDIHAPQASVRRTFGTHLLKAGVPLRQAQAAMRHSDPSLTANVYTEPGASQGRRRDPERARLAAGVG